MKKIILALILLAVLPGCKTEPFKGFLVCKEYTRGHMDDERAESVQEAYMPVPVPVIHTNTHSPEYIPPEWIFYVANKECVMRFRVDSLTYTRHKVGERIVMNLK